MQSQITERMQELGSFINQDVKWRLDVMDGPFRGDIGSLSPNAQETQQVSGREIMDGANDAGGRLIENNEGNTQKGIPSKQLSEAVIGLREEMVECRNRNRQIQETQRKIEQNRRKE